MSGNVEIVRKPLHATGRMRRTLDQRLVLRFPRLAGVQARLIGRLPPGSRLRQAVLWRGAQLGIDAYNRRDLRAVVANAHPDFEYCPDRNWVDAGLLEPSYRGMEQYRRYVAATSEVFGDEVQLEPSELIDLGAQIVVLARAPMRAQVSGVPLTEAWAVVMTVADGRVTRYQEYFDHDEALEAVGLRE